MLLILNGLLLVVIGLQSARGPWLDELTSLWFVQDPFSFLNRVDGDPHPVGYYVFLMLVSALANLTFDPNSAALVPLLRLLTLAFIVGIALLVILVLLRNCQQVATARHPYNYLLLALPSAAMSSVGLGVLTDLRMYGALSIVSSLTGIALWIRSGAGILDHRDMAAISALLALIGSLHVWGTGIAFFMGLATAIVWRPQALSLALILFSICIPIWSLVYFAAPLRSGRSFEDFLAFSPEEFLTRVPLAVSPLLSIQLAVLGLWLISWTLGGRSSGLFLDLPALLMLGTGFLVSLFVLPIYKYYVVAPCISLVIPGILVRWSTRPGLAIPTGVLLLSFGTSLPKSIEDKQDWASTTSFAQEWQASQPSTNVIYAWPENRGVFHTSFFLPNADVRPLSDFRNDVCRSATGIENGGTGLAVLNHADEQKRNDILGTSKLEPLLERRTGGVYRLIC